MSRVALLASLWVLGVEGGCFGKGPGNANVPDVQGIWDVSYDDTLAIEIVIGGATYSETLASGGGALYVDHDADPATPSLEFDIDCSKAEVICPSEAWPKAVTLSQAGAAVKVTVPVQTCDGAKVPATECGEGTQNPDCDEVCEGELVVQDEERLAVITQETQFSVLLGAGLATNGVNCAMLGVSAAKATLATTGTKDTGNWLATEMSAGEVVVGFAGGCLWVGDPDGDDQLEALVLGAGISVKTGFTAHKR